MTEFGGVSDPVRNLAKTEVVKSAAIAALVVALACYPRLVLWAGRAYPIWYLEAVLLLGGFVLWAFVFAWHSQYTGRPLFTLKLPGASCIQATLAGIITVAILYWFVDPQFRATMPEDYPADLQQWIALTLFSLGFNQLFLVFAPFDWAMRLSKREWFAGAFTILFGLFVLVVKTRSSSVEIASSLFWLLVIVRTATSLFSVWFYSRHGVALMWWWGFLLQTRHLLHLGE